MVNPAVVSFWLDNKRVNGTSIAEDGPVKLVRYGSKLYVVEGKDAERRSYSRTSLPPKWKKILSAVSATSTAAGTPAGSAVATAAAALAPSSPRTQPADTPIAKRSPARKSSPVQPEASSAKAQPSGSSSQPSGSSNVTPAKRHTKNSPKTAKITTVTINQEVETDMSIEKENAPVADTVNIQTPAPKVKKAKAPATEPVVATEPAPEPVVKAKTASKAGKPGKARDKAGDLGCSCPYCQHKREMTLADSELDKPVVVVCAGCGREFVLRVVMTYQVQVAGFI